MDKNLQDLDLKEVMKKTQLELEFLQALAQKDFKALSKFNVRGFCKIITREYDIDFTAYLEEYQDFLDEGKEDKKEKKEEANSNITTQLDSYSQKSSYIWLYLIIIILIVAALFAAYKYGFFDRFLNKNNEPINASVVDIVGEAKTNLNSVISTESNLSDENLTEQNEPIQEEENISYEPEQAGTTMQDTISNINKKQEAIFSTNGKVWVGFITLKDYKKTAIVTDQNFSVDLAVDQLILIGATAITMLDNEGKTQDFPSGSSKRFLVKDGKIKSISLSEFMSNNKGREW